MIGTDASVQVLGRMLVSKDQKIVQAACYALEGNPSSAGRAALRSALGALEKARGRGLVAVINLTGDFQDAGSVRSLETLASSGDSTISDAAIRALGRIASKDSIKILQELYKSKTSGKAEAAANALLQAGQELEQRGKRSDAEKIYPRRPAGHGAQRRLRAFSPGYQSHFVVGRSHGSGGRRAGGHAGRIRDARRSPERAVARQTPKNSLLAGGPIVQRVLGKVLLDDRRGKTVKHVWQWRGVDVTPCYHPSVRPLHRSRAIERLSGFLGIPDS